MGCRILGTVASEFSSILSKEAVGFVMELHRKFGPRRLELLARREKVLERINSGYLPTFLEETRTIREGEWKVAPPPAEILNRQVEITGPVDRKMVINALNSGANVYMADFEDSHSPTWQGTLEGQQNLMDAVRRKISFQSPEGKNYSLKDRVAILFVRPRGWHLNEKHVLVDGQEISASLFDFGLFFFHNAKEQLIRGTRPYFYLPKMESHLEARLWRDVFNFSEEYLKIPHGSIRATVLIETVLAAFEMDEILYELRDYSAGLNCGRWDYIFSFIKKFRNFPEFTLPDRAQVTMNVHFLNSYCKLLVKTCHRRGIHAMGGMAAQIPIKNDAEAHAQALEKVTADKKREIGLGFDGTWVAHPGLVEPVARLFKEGLQGPNQISVRHDDWSIEARDLLAVPTGSITEQGLRTNVNVSLLYLESWLRGTGCVPLHHLMEDAATAEISRTQVWQWVRHGRIRAQDFERVLSEESEKIQDAIGLENYQKGKYELAKNILKDAVTGHDFVDFITLPAYSFL